MSDDFKEQVLKYIHVCQLVSSNQLSTDDCEFCDAREDLESSMLMWDGISVEGWTAEERSICLLMLEEEARANPEVSQRVDPFFVVADASLFKASTAMFGTQYDMLGAMLEHAGGLENLESIISLCAQLNIQPFRPQDFHKHIVSCIDAFEDTDDIKQIEHLRALNDAKCNQGNHEITSNNKVT